MLNSVGKYTFLNATKFDSDSIPALTYNLSAYCSVKALTRPNLLITWFVLKLNIRKIVGNIAFAMLFFSVSLSMRHLNKNKVDKTLHLLLIGTKSRKYDF